MFCYQCEQTARGEGCTKAGVCGKPADVAVLQDLLIYALQGLSQIATLARAKGVTDGDVNVFTVKALFSTLTNVNFDTARFAELIRACVVHRDKLRRQAEFSGISFADCHKAVSFHPLPDAAGLILQGEGVGVLHPPDMDPDIRSLQQTLIYGLKGIAAYADHAQILGQEDEAVYAFCHEAIAATLRKDLGISEWLDLVLRCGKTNLRAMELLDAANTGTFGHPAPTPVPLGVRAGKAVLVSGHDLKDLDTILRLTADKGIFVYTHGEMLPTHGYPELKKYPHFYGHYGTAWQNQHSEFGTFPGAILMTTNCLQKPLPEYADRIYTTGLVGWPGIPHLQGELTPVVDKAISLPGFAEDRPGKTVMVGFGRNAVLGVAGSVINAVKAGKIRHFFLVAGCDGAKPGRNYYTEFVEKVPADCVVLTLACGKFRFFDKSLGDIGGIPRLLDIGQCNDAYSAIQIALALAEAVGVGVNELPLSLVLSWYEQKAVAILLTLLALGIKDIRLGPSLPAFLTPNVLKVLVDNYGIRPISTPDEDLKAILG